MDFKRLDRRTIGVLFRSPPHAVVTDIRLGRSDGYALIKAISETDRIPRLDSRTSDVPLCTASHLRTAVT